MARSHSSAFRIGQEEPPGITALSFLPPDTPPPTSSIMRSRLKPMFNSYTPGRFTWPERQNNLVPPFLGGPSAANAAPPSWMMAGTAQYVSTLLSTVGQPKAPETAGNGGRIRGTPRLPSRDSSSADSSPH